VKIVLIGLAVAFVLLVLLEIGLRLLLGFGNPLIYLADEKIGYLLAPSQRTRRFGNRIEINQYSMRSDQIEPKRAGGTLRVLILGDSIANGGWWTDQTEIISAMLGRDLNKCDSGENSALPVEVLNASANSWGPRNELAYIQKYGTFEAQAIVLIINTDDLFATAPTSIPVGRDRNYPAKKPFSAIAEAVNRYLLPAPELPEMAQVNAEGGDRVGNNLEAIGEINAIARQTGANFLLVMTPLLRELGTPGSRDYEITARKRLVDFTQTHQISYIDFLPIFNNMPQPETLYRDHIHLSPQGNQIVSQAVSDFKF
jgi:GDSL-like Lipase/Acylhydrolase family